jgi:exodeoxyribonuclease V alpha subunit
MATTLSGVIIDITFQNEENGYTVLQLQPEREIRPVTCIGTMPTVAKGESVALQGDWETHRRFGTQFTVERYEIIRPTTVEGITQLLGSGLITGIGPARAALIVKRFGATTLDILDKTPERLREVTGIGPKIFEKIKDAWNRQRHIRDLMLFLQEIGVSIGLATRIYKTYGPAAKEKISSDPYSLIDDVWGVGFVKADKIAQSMGFSHDSYKRIRAGICYLLADAAADGHTFLPSAALTPKAAALLGVEETLVVFSLDHAVQAESLISQDGRIYLPHYHAAEKKTAELLAQRLAAPPAPSRVAERAALDRWIEEYQRKNNWRGDPLQIEAIKAAVEQPLFLLTGGPGTGKTTILQVIVSYFRERRRIVALAAPTGRAAQRMGTLAGLAARTIHRLLEFKGGPNDRFGRDEKNPLEADVLIIDEMSMIDLLLMRSLLSAVKPQTSLILVGDAHQLPSVGAGNVLADLIASRRIAHVRLATIFRQAASSRIVTAAHEIIAGTVPSFVNGADDNCFFMEQSDPERCVDTIVDLVARRLPARYGFDPLRDIQALAPMHRGPLGTKNLTDRLQRELNHAEKKIMRGGTTFFLGDKVLQMRNNYDLGVFNGDIGIVVDVAEETGMAVDFDGTIVQYDLRDLDELTPAYCMTIHKSQGCEFKAVIIPIVTQHYILLQRNLLYTALTRARTLCVLVGTRAALSIAVRNNQAVSRYSSLAERLIAALPVPAASS